MMCVRILGIFCLCVYLFSVLDYCVCSSLASLTTSKFQWDFFNCCLDDIVNVIVNGGGKTCAALCANIPNTLYANVCTDLCDVVGIAVFSALLSKTGRN